MIKNKYRTSYCGTLTESDIDKTFTLSGWIENIRDHGGIIFLDLRDETGTIQLVSNDDKMFNGYTKESTVTVEGTLRKRAEEDYNPNLETGTIELLVTKITLLGKSLNVLPFEVKTSHEVSEELRLKYRYLDLRNKKVRKNIQRRAELLMVGGIDKYYQIAPCFRDEDSRADRTLEFYQLDFEMSFVEEEDIYKVGEKIFYDIFTHFSNKKVSPLPFKRIPYKESMLKYGTDKPDLRNPLEIIDITEYLKDTTFKPFQKSTIRAIKVDEIGTNSNSWFNEIVDYASSIGMPGIGYVTLTEDGSLKGPIDKFLTDEERKNLIEKTNLQTNSVLFFIANKKEKNAAKYAGLIRTYLGKKCNLIDENTYEFCIINDFPMFEYNDEEKKYDFCHNPFSMPKGGIEALKTDNLDDIVAYQYDFVCNGYEMSSGALRNHDLDCLELAFEKVGYSKDIVKERFSSLYNAFKYGAPPHGGMAPGIDRMIMLLNDVDNLREVQAFPTSASGIDNLMGSPSELTEAQLRELHIKIR